MRSLAEIVRSIREAIIAFVPDAAIHEFCGIANSLRARISTENANDDSIAKEYAQIVKELLMASLDWLRVERAETTTHGGSGVTAEEYHSLWSDAFMIDDTRATSFVSWAGRYDKNVRCFREQSFELYGLLLHLILVCDNNANRTQTR